MTLTPQWLDELRSRVMLSTLIGRTVKVTRAGREYKACCPFHNEKTPSFTINDEKGFYHCLAPETLVITENGRTPIADLSGKTVRILSRGGEWIEAPFKSYGEQRLWKISLSRNGVAKEIHATSGHRWFVHDRARTYTTEELRPGHALESVLPSPRSDWSLDPEGVRHGIVFGDGSMDKGTFGTLNLHGERDAQLRHWFPDQEHHTQKRKGGGLYLRNYGGRAFSHMKQLPGNDRPPAYLLGFLAGYLAADGHVAKDGTVILNSASAEHLEAVRDVATKLGIATYGRSTLMRKGYGNEPSALHRIHFVASTLSEDLFLLKTARQRFAAQTKKFDRLRWVVRSVEPSNRIETVYCAEVPRHHAFALDDNILTGNCFGCSAHGDAIRWMTDQRGLSFMDAVKELAAEAGMEVPAADPRAAKKAEEAASLRDVVQGAADWFTQQLDSSNGAPARDYLAKRGISDPTRRAFGFGLAPDSRSALKEALKKFPTAMLIESGMLIAVDDKEPYDRFRGRLMIPIRDARGRVIAFGGRILGGGEPKYLNSPDTPLFDKGRVLYNIDKASPASRQTNRIIVVEGYMDVIALAEAGIADAVAPLGTALTEAQLGLIWRMVPVPVLCFDGDAAGQKAAMRAAMRALPLLRPGFSLAFAILPPGQDPDDIVRARGADGFTALLDEAQPLVERLWAHEIAAGPLATPEERAALKTRLLAHADAIEDADVRHHYREAFRERLDTLFARKQPERTPRVPWAPQPQRGGNRRFGPDPRLQPPVDEARSIGKIGIGGHYAAALIAGLLRYPAAIRRHEEALTRLAVADSSDAELLRVMLDSASGEEGLDCEGLLAILEPMKVYNRATTLLRADGMHFSFNRRLDGEEVDVARETALRDLDEYIGVLVTQPEIRTRLAEATADYMRTMDDEGHARQQKLRAMDEELTRRLAALSDSSPG
ncbi:DNA primase [Sphingopyxis sp.]|uniref:DNA primase n=1 Tax=Sphingopyxis sp. TaxID=1908224 RepID=UPI0025D0E765|nr:DNA primase [Sphingopyxis sp.]